MAKNKPDKARAGRPSTGRIRVHVVFDPDILKQIETAVAAEGRGFSDQVNFMLRNAFNQKK